MQVTTYIRGDSHYPSPATKMHHPPEQLYGRGAPLSDILALPRVAIVGSRLVSPYGKQVTYQFARQLAEQGIVIVSGLAIGVDAIAHEGALSVGGRTLAVLPSPVERPAPATNRLLAERIIASGGALLSQYPAGSENHKGNFLARNELVAALSDVVLITEAATKSGSLHTANFALAMGVSVQAVPGNITSPTSAGTNRLLKTGADIAASIHDVLNALGLRGTLPLSALRGDTAEEQAIIDLLLRGITDGSELLTKSQQTIMSFNQNLTMLEISGKIIALGGNHWGLP